MDCYLLPYIVQLHHNFLYKTVYPKWRILYYNPEKILQRSTNQRRERAVLMLCVGNVGGNDFSEIFTTKIIPKWDATLYHNLSFNTLNIQYSFTVNKYYEKIPIMKCPYVYIKFEVQ